MTVYLQDPDVILCACGCGATIQSPDAKGRPRRFARGHNLRVDHPRDREGYVPSFVGRTHTAESRAKIASAAARPRPWLRGPQNGMAGRTGSSNPNWRGGGAPERQRLYGRFGRVRRQRHHPACGAQPRTPRRRHRTKRGVLQDRRRPALPALAARGGAAVTVFQAFAGTVLSLASLWVAWRIYRGQA